jgi:type I site-specific restriction-modification system R (restriction) subunit
VVFINGIPLALLELKNIADEQATIRKAFDQFQTYKAQIPSLFHSNALLVISDGHKARLGTVTSDWERFMTWRTITGKELVPPGSLQLETLLKLVLRRSPGETALCAPCVLCVRNFISYAFIAPMRATSKHILCALRDLGGITVKVET